jgi:hypothetical protein
VVGTALRELVNDHLPTAEEIDEAGIDPLVEVDAVRIRKLILGRKGQGEQIPALALRGPAFDGTVVVWVHPKGKASLFTDGKLSAAAKKIIDAKAGILAPDVFGTGEFGEVKPAVNAGYTFAYNRPLLANRVHDILTAVGYAKNHQNAKTVHLLGLEEAGPWVVLARGLSGDVVSRTAADLNRFAFASVKAMTDPAMLPGALKYGGLPAFLALSAPSPMFLYNHEGTGVEEPVKAAYAAAGTPEAVQLRAAKESTEGAVQWLLR